MTWPTDMETCRDNTRRAPVDTGVPVVEMPAWANPGYLDSLLLPPDHTPWSPNLTCHTDDVRWREINGTRCWFCGKDLNRPLIHAQATAGVA